MNNININTLNKYNIYDATVENLQEIFDEALKKEEVDTIMRIMNHIREWKRSHLDAFLNKIPKKAKTPSMKLFVKRFADYAKVQLTEINPRKKKYRNELDRLMAGTSAINNVFYDYPRYTKEQFFQLPYIKQNIEYSIKLSRFEKELIEFYWSDSVHVLAIHKNMKILNPVLTKIFNNAPALTQDITVYRGVSAGDTTSTLTKLTNLTSTSLNIDVAYDFRYTKCCLFKILLPKGTKFIVPTLKETDVLSWQQEILLPPGGALKLIKETYDYRYDGRKNEKVFIQEYKYTPKINFNETPDIKATRNDRQFYKFYKEVYDAFLQQKIRFSQLNKGFKEVEKKNPGVSVYNLDVSENAPRDGSQRIPENAVSYRSYKSNHSSAKKSTEKSTNSSEKKSTKKPTKKPTKKSTKNFFLSLIYTMTNVNKRDRRGRTVLMRALEDGASEKLLNEILDMKPNIRLVDKEGSDALNYALRVRYILKDEKEIGTPNAIIQRILSMKPDINLQDKYGNTALMNALKNKKSSRIINQILKMNPKINVQNASGTTALMFAIGSASVPIIKKILTMKPDISLRDTTLFGIALTDALLRKDLPASVFEKLADLDALTEQDIKLIKESSVLPKKIKNRLIKSYDNGDILHLAVFRMTAS
jgi:hypothetical protein